MGKWRRLREFTEPANWTAGVPPGSLWAALSALSRDRAVGAFGFAHWESSAGLWRGPLVVLRKELYAGSGFRCASGYSSDREAEPEMERSD